MQRARRLVVTASTGEAHGSSEADEASSADTSSASSAMDVDLEPVLSPSALMIEQERHIASAPKLDDAMDQPAAVSTAQAVEAMAADVAQLEVAPPFVPRAVTVRRNSAR
jgi:hypothetical protein